MKILKIDHIGVAVKSIDDAKNFFVDKLGMNLDDLEEVAEQKVRVGFMPVGDSELELLESTAPDGPIAKYIDKNGQGVQHVAFRVDNIEEAIKELKGKGVRMINEEPRPGAGGNKIAFIHPKETYGVLVEICERE